ncbi:CBY1-interacting BAR domain-containing protein 1-A [Anopheles bellator]|uniref:CBY1-interacting BAR domain-containing protein 1-A n=1 Tax=Anopheles bellator TaxID=139047 RepID=UPI002647F214|nr:CBY1-interacting BAR domain-containing protein 1-A [Anopheles bellator]
MLRGTNRTTLLCEEQTKFILDRIGTVEKQFSELCGALAEYTRKLARVRDKSDELAQSAQEYCDAEKYNTTMANALSSLAKAITLIGDFQDGRVKRLETRIVSELAQYESVCKHCKEGVKEALQIRDKDLTKRKQLEQNKNRNGRGRRTANDTEIIKSNLEVEKSLKEIESLVGRFEKQKLKDVKQLLLNFVMIEMKFHTQAVEVLSATYQDISDIDESKDYQGVHKELKRQNRQFKKYLQRDTLPDRYLLQRIKSQSMGALNATIAGFTAGRKNKSLSSNSLNSSQEQEPDHVSEQQLNQAAHKHASRRTNRSAVQQSIESLESVKREVSTESKTSSEGEDDDSEASDTETGDSDTPVTLAKPAAGTLEGGKKSQVDSSFKIIKLKDYNP